MKALLLAISVTFVTPCFAECNKEAAVAVRFMNQYLAYNNAVYEKSTNESLNDWLKRNQLVSSGFPKSVVAKTQEGLRNDPELGWGKDVILNAQDSPNKGFKLFKCSSTPGFVMLQGTDWPEFKVTVKVIKTKAGRKVDGAGIVNIPEKERPQR